LGTTSETHEAIAAGANVMAIGRGGATAAPMLQARSPFSALPEGWAVLGRCRSGTGCPGPHATGCYALGHPDIGIALIDIAPDATPNAEARLRRAIAGAAGRLEGPGDLPIVHERMEMAALRILPWLLDKWFAAMPAPTHAGGLAWMEGVRTAMAADPAWELPGHPKAAPETAPLATGLGDLAVPAPRSAERPRHVGRRAALPAAFAGVFVLGLASGVLLLQSSGPADPGTPAAATAPKVSDAAAASGVPDAAQGSMALRGDARGIAAGQDTGATPQTSASGLPAAGSRPAGDEASAAGAAQAPTMAPPAADAPGAAPPAAAASPEVELAAGAGNGPVPAATSVEPRASYVASGDEGLPLAPPRAPAPPVRVSALQQTARAAPVIDRACSQALFRFQQGERLTATDQNFIRSGCTTARR
jgi:hypothetical protein